MWWKILYNKAIKNSHQNIKFGASFSLKFCLAMTKSTYFPAIKRAGF